MLASHRASYDAPGVPRDKGYAAMAETTTAGVKVSRDGTVTREGVVIGSVEKVIRDGLYETQFGASYGSNTPVWFPVTTDGKRLSKYGFNTRREAVSRLDGHTAPMTVSHVKRENHYLSGFNNESRPFVSASIRFKGYWFSVSRYATESDWIVDAYSTPDSIMPVFSHGSGARYTKLTVITDQSMIDAVNRAASDAGVWPIID